MRSGAEGTRFSAPGSPVRADAGEDSGGERERVEGPSAVTSGGVSSGKSVVTGKSATGDESDEVVQDWVLWSRSRNRDFWPAVWSWVTLALLMKGVLPPGEPTGGTTGSLSRRREVRSTGFTGDAGEESFGGGVEKASSVRSSYATCTTDLGERVEIDEDEDDRWRARVRNWLRGGMRSLRSVRKNHC